MSETATLCLFVKAPTPGQAKTRLAPALGQEGAAALACAFARDGLDLWSGSGPELCVARTGDFDGELARELADIRSIPQGEGDLGERMERALRHGLAETEVAMVVGTDIPGLGPKDAEEALRLLQTHDAVLGPAEDGGFTLIALRSCPPGLLRGLPWSSSRTLERTIERLRGEGMSVATLPPRFDVDEPQDLAELGRFLRAHPGAMPHTRRFLASSRNQMISLVIPVLNEEARLQALLSNLQREARWGELIVVDGGSRDATVSIANSFPGVRVLHSSPGRARQMNQGASQAMGGTLLFLHADAQLPASAAEEILGVMKSGEHVAGAFRLQTRYDERGRSRPWVKPFLRMADWRSRYSGLPYGDQALFVRTRVFRELGGYPDIPLFEDLDLSSRLARKQALAILPSPVVVSGRRFQERPLYYLALMNSFPLLYRLGVSPQRLARFYHASR